MGTFAEAAIVDYHWSFADQGKQTSIFFLRLQQTNGSLPFLFSVCSKKNGSCHFPLVSFFICGIPETWNMETWKHGNMETWTWRNRNMETWTWNSDGLRKKSYGKQKKEAQAIFLNLFTILFIARTEVYTSSICWWSNKRKLSVCKRNKLTCLSVCICTSRNTGATCYADNLPFLLIWTGPTIKINQQFFSMQLE